MVAGHEAKLAAVARAEASLKADAQQVQAELAAARAARDGAEVDRDALRAQVRVWVNGE
jgi:hypothetical protein